MKLREFASDGATMKIFNRFLGEILATGDVDGGEPAFFAPAPNGAGRDADIFRPFLEADDRRRRHRENFAICVQASPS